jgi:cytohesin
MAVSYRGDDDIALLLIEKGADARQADWRGWTMLHYAASYDRTSVVEQLIAKGADVNAKSAFGTTPLMCAAENGKIEAAKVLLAHGAKINQRMPSNEDDLPEYKPIGDEKIDKSRRESWEYMTSSARENSGRSALDLAREKEKQDMVEFLRKHGAR